MNDQRQVLMLRRKHTFSFLEFLRGHYDTGNVQVLIFLLQTMSVGERNMIRDATTGSGIFMPLWEQVFVNHHRPDCLHGHIKWDLLKIRNFAAPVLWHDAPPGAPVIHTHGTRHCVRYKAAGIQAIRRRMASGNAITVSAPGSATGSPNLSPDSPDAPDASVQLRTDTGDDLFGQLSWLDFLDAIPCTFTEQEWGFPKGRKHHYENEWQCATREFTEETHVPSRFLQYHDQCISEEYIGSNDVEYSTRYFVCSFIGDLACVADSMGEVVADQSCEVSCRRWVSIDEGLALLRPTQVTKHSILALLDQLWTARADKYQIPSKRGFAALAE